jgi:hypothetical protein
MTQTEMRARIGGFGGGISGFASSSLTVILSQLGLCGGNWKLDLPKAFALIGASTAIGAVMGAAT